MENEYELDRIEYGDTVEFRRKGERLFELVGVDPITVDAIESALREAHEDGDAFNKGHDEGYDEGYDAGHDEGYKEGYAQAQKEAA